MEMNYTMDTMNYQNLGVGNHIGQRKIELLTFTIMNDIGSLIIVNKIQIIFKIIMMVDILILKIIPPMVWSERLQNIRFNLHINQFVDIAIMLISHL